MSQLFGRRVKLTLATVVKTDDYANTLTGQVVEISDLRVQFKVKKTSKKHPNTAEVTASNLTAERRQSLQAKGVKFILQAGYVDNLVQIFQGDARTIDHVRDGADWNTVIKSGDGERAFKYARINESFKGGTGAADVVKRIVGKLGIGDGNLKDFQTSNQFVNGYSVRGPASAELDKILRGCGYEWSIQDGALQVLPVDGSRDLGIPEFTPETGLIGSPEFGTPEKKGKPPLCKIKVFLDGRIKPGGRISIKSERYKGQFRVKQVEHTGDTHGGDWYSAIEALPIG